MPAGSLAPPPVLFAALVEGRRKPFALRIAVFLLSLETLVREGGIHPLIAWWSSSQVSRLSISPSDISSSYPMMSVLPSDPVEVSA